jgi:hypothetical protein
MINSASPDFEWSASRAEETLGRPSPAFTVVHRPVASRPLLLVVDDELPVL